MIGPLLFFLGARIELNGLLFETIINTNNVTLIGSYDSWSTLKNQNGNLEIPNVVSDISSGITYSVHSIKEFAFQNCQDLISIKMADSIEEINMNSFSSCINLNSILFSKNLKRINHYAFNGCISLQNVKIESALISMVNCFEKCDSLKSIDLSKTSLSSLNMRLFSDLTSLETVILPPTVIGIGDRVFENCHKLLSVNLDNVKYIGVGVFKNCWNLQKLDFPPVIEEIDDRAFENCQSLVVVDFYSTSLKSIGSNAFLGCVSLKSVVFPATTVLSNETFKGCKSLTNAALPNLMTSIPSGLFSDCTSLKEIILPLTIIEINEMAFSQAVSMNNIVIPMNVQKISPTAFFGCISLVSFMVHQQNTKIVSMNGFLVSLPDTVIAYPQGKTDKIVTIPDQIKVISQFALSGNHFIETILLNKVESLEQWAIYGCGSLKEVYISSSTTKIHDMSIKNCLNLQKVSVDKGNLRYHEVDGLIIDSTEVLLCPPNHPNRTIIIPNGIQRISNNAFEFCQSIETIILPPSLIIIENEAFFMATSLTSMVIPKSVITIGESCFKNCISMTSIEIGEISALPENFLYGTAIKEINIPKSVSIINSDSLSGLNFLESIVVESENNAFQSINGVLFTKDSKKIVYYPSNHPNKLFNIDDGVTLMRNDVLKNAKNLEKITASSSTIYHSFGGVLYDSSTYSLIQIPYNIQNETLVLFDQAQCGLDYEFLGMKNVKRFEISQSNKGLYTVNGVLYNKFHNLLKVPPSYDQDTLILDSITSYISPHAFRFCNNIKKIEVDSGNKHFRIFDGVLFDNYLFRMVYYPIKKDSPQFSIPYTTISLDSSFIMNDYLTAIAVEHGNDLFSSKDGILYDKVKSTIIRCPPRINNVSISLPSSITNIGSYSFQNCLNVKSIYINSQYISYFGENVFVGMTKLDCISYSGKSAPYNFSIPQTIEAASIYVSESYLYQKFGLLSVKKSDGDMNNICNVQNVNHKENNATWVIVACSSGGVVLILVFFIVYIKKRKREEGTTTDFIKF